MDDSAWPVLLQHNSIRKKLQVICRLLCCSKVLRAAVSHYSAGQLTICIGRYPWRAASTQYERLATWVAANGRLLHTLDISEGALWSDVRGQALVALFASALAAAADSATKGPSTGNSSSSSSGGDYGGDSDGGSNSSLAGAGGRTNVAAVLDGAVQAAEESDAGVPNSANAAAAVAVQPAAHVKQQQLPLHAFRAAKITSPALLQHLPGQLRSLSITLSWSCTAEQAQQIASSLSRLTGLTQLCMNIRDEQFLVAAALTSFRQLQVLELKNVSSPAALQHLPQQLKQLHFTQGVDSTAGAMQLQHLTALTALDCSCTAGRPVSAGDVLPAGLALLRAAVLDLEPVLALRHLQRLEIAVYLPAIASQLGQLTALQALKALHLQTGVMAAVGAALLLLPVKHLKVFWDISATAVQQLGQLQGLTSLVLLGKWFRHYQKLPESLQQLTALRQLCLNARMKGPALLNSAGLSLQFVTALPELQSFGVLDTPLDPASITALQAATGLTYLEIDVPHMAQDWAVAAMVEKLTLLQHLSLGPRTKNK